MEREDFRKWNGRGGEVGMLRGVKGAYEDDEGWWL